MTPASLTTAPLLALEADAEQTWERAVTAGRDLAADGVVLPAALLPSTNVPEIDAIAFALAIPVPAVCTPVALPAGVVERDRLITLVRVAQRLGGDGARLLLQPETGWASGRDRDALALLVASLTELSRAFAVVLALDPGDESSASVATWCATRVPGVTVVRSGSHVSALDDDVVAREVADASDAGGRRARWRLVRQSELVRAGG